MTNVPRAARGPGSYSLNVLALETAPLSAQVGVTLWVHRHSREEDPCPRDTGSTSI